MIKPYLKSQKGATIVASGLLIASLLGFVGLITDVGNIYIEKARMQDTVDAAALAGAQEAPRSDKVKQMANQYVKANNKNAGSKAAEINWNDEKGQLTVTLEKNIPTYFMRVFGCNSVPITVYAIAIRGNGSEEYAIYSNKGMNWYNTEMRGAVYSGSNIHYYGREESLYNHNKLMGSIETVGFVDGLPDEFITFKGEEGKTKEKVPKKEMPQYPLPGKRTVCNKTKLTAADLAGDALFIKGGTIVELGSDVTEGTIISDGNINITLTNLTMKNPLRKLFIYTSGDEIRLDFHGPNNINAIIYAPNGTVSLLSKETFTINGSIIADRVQAKTKGTIKVFGPNGGTTTSSTSSKLFG